MKPLAVDLCCGLGGWSEGLIAEGWDVVGFDNVRHHYGDAKYPGQLVLQDILTLDGRQFRGKVSLIVASPPCTEYSYMSMPWKRAKQIASALRGCDEFPDGYTGSRNTAELTRLFDACVRIGREAECPIVIENVRGAQPWIGRAKYSFGSFYLWGDVPALMPMTRSRKNGGGSWFIDGISSTQRNDPRDAHLDRAIKTVGHINQRNGHSHTRHLTNQAEHDGVNVHGNKLSENGFAIPVARELAKSMRRGAIPLNANDKRLHLSSARKAASAHIAKIPFVLAQHIARAYYPEHA